MKARLFWIPAIVAALMAAPAALHAQTPMGTAFTYQGQLKQASLPVTNTADVKFSLWDDVTTPPGIQVGPTLVFDGQPGNPGPVNVVNGLFTVVLDFGSGIFTGDARWLQIEVRVPHDPGNTLPYTTLSPRQELTPTPYAVYAAKAGSPDGHSLDAADGSPTDAVYVDNDGNVGIGTTDPDYKLQVNGKAISGVNNSASGSCATVSGGEDNVAAGTHATVAGGWANNASGNTATVAGGLRHIASNEFATVGGGWVNMATGGRATVGGGRENKASGHDSTVPGGVGNVAAGDFSFAAGRWAQANHRGTFVWSDPTDPFASTGENQFLIDADGGVGIGTPTPSEELDVAGNIHASGTITSGSSITIDGANDKITASSGTLSFDDENIVTTGQATIGPGHTSTGLYPFVAGASNTASGGNYITVCGYLNTAGDHCATVGGGYQSTASGHASTVGGGQANTASGIYGTVSGGIGNVAGGYGSTASGFHSSALGDHSTVGGGEGNTTEGDRSAICGGSGNVLTPSADWSMAFGRDVYVDNPYRVVFFEGFRDGRLGINRDDNDGGINHPIHVGTDGTNGNGAHLTANGVWTNGSSREFKENFEPLDGEELVSKISNMSVEAWQFKDSDERHIGPVAEDFVEAFDVGANRGDGTRESQYLAASDVAGVALAGVKELARQNQEIVKEKQAEIEALRARLEALETLVAELAATKDGGAR